MSIRLRHVIGGLSLYATGMYAGLVYNQGRTLNEDALAEKVPTEARNSAFDNIAPRYDRDIWLSEKFSGIDSFRKNLLQNATGRVLEVAAGTGRNLEFYSSDCDLVLVDQSMEMAKVAYKKTSEIEGLRVKYLVQDATAMELQDESFDTVVDTFGLCSMEDPVRVLAEMGRVCKRDGRILLLEHGRTHWNFEWLNNYLDNRATAHAHDWGCYWNKNIERIVEQSGLEVVEKKTHHFGTCYEMVLKRRDE